MIMMKKFTGIKMAANMPKALIGLMSDSVFARKAAAVVLEVTVIARKERLNEYATRLFSSFDISSRSSDCLQASQ